MTNSGSAVKVHSKGKEAGHQNDLFLVTGYCFTLLSDAGSLISLALLLLRRFFSRTACLHY
jgi:hypothetical protein